MNILAIGDTVGDIGVSALEHRLRDIKKKYQVDFAIVNGNYALDAKITDLLLTSEQADSEGAQTYANIIAVREGEEASAKTQVLIDVLTSDEIRSYISEHYNGLVVPVK